MPASVRTRRGDARGGDLEGQFEAWSAKLRPVAAKELGITTGFDRSGSETPLYAIEPVASTVTQAIAGASGAMPVKIVANAELQNKSGPNASPRSTRHIEVELPAGVTYRVGDHLSVLPRNEAALVEAVARRFGFMSADRIRLNVERSPSHCRPRNLSSPL